MPIACASLVTLESGNAMSHVPLNDEHFECVAWVPCGTRAFVIRSVIYADDLFVNVLTLDEHQRDVWLLAKYVREVGSM